MTSRRQRRINRSNRALDLLRQAQAEGWADRSPDAAEWDAEEATEPPNGPFRDGAVWVLSRKCPTCIFRPGNLMQLQDGRVDQMAEECVRESRIIPCHETLDGPRSVCRGLYDLYFSDLGILQVADRLGMLSFDDPPEEH